MFLSRVLMKVVAASLIIILAALVLYSLPQEKIASFFSYPNPFDSRKQSAKIYYYLNTNSHVSMKIYDAFGMLVKEYSFNEGTGSGSKGWNKVIWDGENENGDKVGKGGYICYLETESGGQLSKSYHKIGVIH
ncbi:MAG: FlgD immunoglobulin-like domain containing protein [bacterium]